MKKQIRIFINWLADQKMFLDLGIGLLSMVNFGLLLLVNSKRLSDFIGINERTFLGVGMLCGFLGVWLIGKLMVLSGWRQRYLKKGNAYNPTYVEMHEKLDKLLELHGVKNE